MKDGIHPEYRPVVFEDQSAERRWLCGSTARTERRTVWEDGMEYPHVIVDISMYSHPFFTGQMKIVDTAGRVERFNQRYGQHRSKR